MFSEKYIRHYKRHWFLALPVVFGQVGHMITSLADTVMVGKIGSIPLAAASYAHTIYILFFLFLIGLANGLTPVTGLAFGEGNKKRCKGLLINGIAINLVSSIVFALVMFFSSGILYYFGQDTNVVQQAIPYYNYLAFSIIPVMIFIAFKQFIEGMELTKPAMYVSIVCNLINVLLNYIFIHGKLGFPAMGLNGAGLATFISRVLMMISMMLYVFYHKKLKQYYDGLRLKYLSISEIKLILKIGLPIGIQYIFEVGCFSMGAIFIGWLGSNSLAAHQIALNLASLTFMMASGISTSATIRISNLIGQKDFEEMKMASKTALIMVVFFMATTATLFIFARNYLPTLFIYDANVIEIASTLIVVAAFFQISDGIQVTAIGILRGMHDVKIPTYIGLLAYWFISLPTGYFFAFNLNFGAKGIWFGYLTGLSVAAFLFFFRYKMREKTIIKQGGIKPAA